MESLLVSLSAARRLVEAVFVFLLPVLLILPECSAETVPLPGDPGSETEELPGGGNSPKLFCGGPEFDAFLAELHAAEEELREFDLDSVERSCEALADAGSGSEARCVSGDGEEPGDDNLLTMPLGSCLAPAPGPVMNFAAQPDEGDKLWKEWYELYLKLQNKDADLNDLNKDRAEAQRIVKRFANWAMICLPVAGYYAGNVKAALNFLKKYPELAKELEAEIKELKDKLRAKQKEARKHKPCPIPSGLLR